jgi:predicted amidophosphoribosyltransferase
VATVEEFTNPHLGTYTPPPPAGLGVCDVCHGVPNAGYVRCWSCDQSTESVSHPCELLVPISLYRVGEQLHTVLKDYKRSPDERVRARHRYQVAAILHRFLRDHAGCIEAVAGTAWDTVTIVPSKTPGADPHPLEQAIKLGKKLKATYQPLLAPDQPETIDRVYGDNRAFRTIEDVTGKQVLLIDDTFTSGATFQSAASRLALDGATVVAGLAIGRVITTGDPRYPANDALWERQREIAFSFDRCCLEP